MKKKTTLPLNITVENITPNRAAQLLDQNPANRRINQGTVAKYRADMVAGRWRFAGDPIRISTDGSLLDGQHRLMAVKQQDRAFDFVVLRDLPVDMQIVMDSGRKRTLSDFLTMRGEKCANALAASLPYMRAFLQGEPLHTVITGRRTHGELLAALDAVPEIRDSIIGGVHFSQKFRVSSGVMVFRHWHFGQINVADREEFFLRARTERYAGNYDPVLQLVTRLREDAASRQARMDTQLKHGLLVKAWNSFRTGRLQHNLRWRRGGAKAEAFPVAE